MNAVLQPVEARFEPLTRERLDAVLAVEQSAYAHPWVRANFIDALDAGYQAQVLLAGDLPLGYFVAMKGVDEVHLLNITVAPAYQRSMPWPSGRAARAPAGSGWRCAWATCARSRSTKRMAFSGSACARPITRPVAVHARTPLS